MNIAGSTILILGAGQVGVEVARQCLGFEPVDIVLHCLTEQEAEKAGQQLDPVPGNVNLELSWGNVLWPTELANTDSSGLDDRQERVLLDFFYGELSQEIIQGASLHCLVKEFQPDFIIDAINTATAVGYHQCVHDAVRQALAGQGSVNSIALSSPVPQIVRFVQVLKEAMSEFKVDQYIKVSTTGLGGMGFNIMYTHGDLGEPGLSTKLLGKVSAAGILHQLLWTLSHTPGYNVNLIIPAALIGFEGVGHQPVIMPGRGGLPTKLVDSDPIPITNLSPDQSLDEYEARQLEEDLTGVVVDSGENGHYSWHDMAAITALGQMGPVTKEEVAAKVVSAMWTGGDISTCLLRAMDLAQLDDSGLGYQARAGLMERMAGLSTDVGVPSTSFMNLGPRIAKYLWELEILGSVTDSLHHAVGRNCEALVLACQECIQANHLWRQMILACGLPIITEQYLWLPDRKGFTWQSINESAANECVDLRTKRISFWKDVFRGIIDFIGAGNVPVHSNVDSVIPGEPIKPGELLGLWFTLQGGGKKKS